MWRLYGFQHLHSAGKQTEGNADERFWLCFGLRRLNDSLQGLVLSLNEQLGRRLVLQGVPVCFELLHGREEDFICLSGGIGGEPLNLTNCWKLQTCTHSCLDALGTSGCDLGTNALLQKPPKPHLPPQFIATPIPLTLERRKKMLFVFSPFWGGGFAPRLVNVMFADVPDGAFLYVLLSLQAVGFNWELGRWMKHRDTAAHFKRSLNLAAVNNADK